MHDNDATSSVLLVHNSSTQIYTHHYLHKLRNRITHGRERAIREGESRVRPCVEATLIGTGCEGDRRHVEVTQNGKQS